MDKQSHRTFSTVGQGWVNDKQKKMICMHEDMWKSDHRETLGNSLGSFGGVMGDIAETFDEVW